MAEFGDRPERLVEPGPLLELEPQTRKFFLEDPAALDIVGNHRARRAIDEQQNRAVLGAEILAQVAPGGEPGDRVGPAQDDRVLLGRVEELANPLVLLLDVLAPPRQLGVFVIGRGVRHDRQAVIVRPISGRDTHRVELTREVDVPGNDRDQSPGIDFRGHFVASVKRRQRNRLAMGVRTSIHALAMSFKGLGIGFCYPSMLRSGIQGSARPNFEGFWSGNPDCAQLPGSERVGWGRRRS